MRSILFRLGVLGSVLAALNASADSYTISIPPGYTLIANHLDHGGNTLDEVLPGMPDGAQVLKYICTNTYVTNTYSASLPGWIPSGGTLAPGEGAFFNNPGAVISVTFTGTPHTPVLPPPLPCGCSNLNLVSAQTTNSPSTFTDIMGFPPPNSLLAKVYRWNGSGYTIYNGNAAICKLLVNLGESVFVQNVCVPGNPCPINCLTLTCAANKTVECGSNWSFNDPTLQETCCGTNFTLTILSTVTNSSGPCSQMITRTWQATDCSNNTATCSQTVTVADNTPPVVTCASNKTVQCNSTWDFDPPTAFDACCGTNVTITTLGTTTNGSCPQLLVHTWSITDCCGNSSPCSQTVTLQDTNPPVLTCAGGKTVECGSTWDFDPPAALDACCGTNVTITVVNTVTNGAGPCSQVITRTWQATDCCTNRAMCSQTVTVADTIPPALTCADGKSVQCGTTWSFDPPTALDACCGTNVTITVVNTVTNGPGPCSQVITRTWQATDCCSNIATCSQTVTITGTAPPPNDNCANAVPVGVGSPAACGSTAQATPSPSGSIPPPCGTSSDSPDVWYTFTPVCTGIIAVDTCGLCAGLQGPYDTVLSVYSGSCGSLTLIDCNDDAGGICGLQSRVAFSAVKGVAYHIRVAGNGGAAGDFRLNIYATATPPINDNCADAIAIDAGSPAACGSTACATPSPAGSIPPPCGASSDSPDVWYTFAPTCDGPITIDTCGLCPGQPSTFDTVLSAYTGACGSLTQVACNDDAGESCGLQSRITFFGTARTLYHIRVAGAGGAAVTSA